jgi:hypothetical protein
VIATGAPQREGDVLVVLMSHYPGWKVVIDGQPAPLTFYNGYLGAKMLPGEHSYVFYFLPTQYMIGASISALTLGLMLVIALSPPLQSLIKKMRQTRSPTVFQSR